MQTAVRRTIVTGTDWKTTESPVTYSSIYGGEDYDATKEQTGWRMTGHMILLQDFLEPLYLSENNKSQRR